VIDNFPVQVVKKVPAHIFFIPFCHDSQKGIAMKLRLAIAEDDLRTRQFLEEILSSLGHTVVSTTNGTQLLDACRKEKPDLVITDIKMPDMDGLDVAKAIWNEFSIPAIIISGFTEEELLERASAYHIMAFLVKPIKKADLAPAIHVAMRRFAELQELMKETSDLRQALQERKLIERAKGVTMKRAGLDEPAAFRRMQEMARNTNRKLVQIAEMIITAEEAFSRGLNTDPPQSIPIVAG
jgi:response regulator NasT